MTKFNLEEALQVARSAADAGAAAVMRGRKPEHLLTIRDKKLSSFVTEVDEEAQKVILGVIRARYPDHRFLAEEEGADHLGDPGSPYRWIIDALDGTTPFIHGKDTFGTIVALEERGKTIAGAMTIPARNERFWGAKGKGAFFNGNPVRLRKTRDLKSAILCTNTNCGPRTENGMLVITSPQCASLQCYGCAACEFADVLKGQNDGYFFNGIHLWDGAAGLLLMEEAGGKAAYEFWDPADQRGYMRGAASTELIFEQLQAFVFGGERVASA